jgi:hypothetical protein
MALNTSDTCTVVFRPEIWSAAYIDHSPYPDEPIWIGPEYTFQAPGGTWTKYFSLGADVCLYDRWFAVITYMNTDDRLDPAYCPDGNAIPDYQSWIFDITGRLEQSYWGPYAEYGLPYGWFDVVENGICSGAIRVRTQGYNRPENACPILPDDYYYKVGLPDFYQYQDTFPNNGIAYCGPVAGANSIWWFACVDSQFPPSWGGCDPGMEIALIEEIADSAGTDPVLGTNCNALEAALIGVIQAHGGWWFTETTVYAPEFWYLQYQLRICEDVVLLLGFWQEDPPGVWNRFGGHFVTLAGVDYTNYAFALSDPATPTVIDKYFVAWPSVSPGGVVWIPDYYLPWIVCDTTITGDPPETTIVCDTTFQGQNAGPLPNTGTYNEALPVYVEVEQAIVVSPGPYKMSGTVESSKAYETENNMGGIEAFGVKFGAVLKSGLYYGTFIKGNSQDNLTCDYGDYAPLHTFKPLGPPVLDEFIIAGAAGNYTIQQLTLKFAHPILPLEITKYAFGVWIPVGGTEECEYAIEDVFVIKNVGTVAIEGLKDGMWLDYDISAGGVSDLADHSQKYNSIWMWDVAAPDSVFGITKKPLIPGPFGRVITGHGLSQAARVYDGQYMDSLFYWMENLGWCVDNPTTPEDKSIILVDTNYTLAPGAMQMEKYLKWGYGNPIDKQNLFSYGAWRCFLYKLLHQEGFYRGDVNQDGRCNATDKAILNAYVNAGGPPPIEFADQGDVNCDGIVNQADVDYIDNFVNHGGPAPIDKNRFLDNSPFVDPVHKALGIRNPGLFGDPDWARLVDKRGDANGDEIINVTDVIYLINWLFKGGPVPTINSDVNCSGKVDVTDVIYLINYLFKGGPEPCPNCS